MIVSCIKHILVEKGPKFTLNLFKHTLLICLNLLKTLVMYKINDHSLLLNMHDRQLHTNFETNPSAGKIP